MRDLWTLNTSSGTNRPAKEHQNGPGCSQRNQSGGRCVYEEAVLTAEVKAIIARHDPASPSPLFLFWAPHLVHMPLQVPLSPLSPSLFALN